MIWVSPLTVLVSEEEEGYTIGKSGLKHQERQNSQSWAHKLHWCGIIWSFAFGACLPSPCAVLLLLYHLSCPELTSKWTAFSQFHYIRQYTSFVLIPLLFGLYVAVLPYLDFSCFTLCVSFLSVAASQSFGSQSARLAVWRVSGGSLPNLMGSQLHKSELLCCFAPPHLCTRHRNIT